MKKLTIGACVECLSPLQTEHSWESPPFARENATMGDANVAQVLGRHWYEEHSHRYGGDYIIVRRYLSESSCVMVIGRPVMFHTARVPQEVVGDVEAKKWAESMIEVCSHEDGIDDTQG